MFGNMTKSVHVYVQLITSHFPRDPSMFPHMNFTIKLPFS
jgi:hypothetical protein